MKHSVLNYKGPSAAQDGKLRWQNRKMVRNKDHLHLILARNQAAGSRWLLLARQKHNRATTPFLSPMFSWHNAIFLCLLLCR